MPRGRKRIPDAVLALRGGSRHHRAPEIKPAPATVPPPRPPGTFEVPDWLTSGRARFLFRQVVEDYLQRRIIRAPDFIVAGRWSHYLDRWLEAKGADDLDLQIKIERELRPLEDRLGLSPAARQDILRGLAVLPAAIREMLAAEDKQSGSGATVPPVGEAGGVPTAGDQPSSAAPSPASPLGFLRLVTNAGE